MQVDLLVLTRARFGCISGERIEKARKQTVRSSLRASKTGSILTASPMEAVPISRSRKAGRDAINNIHGGIPLSVSGFLCFFSAF